MKHKLLILLSLFVLMPICIEAQEAPLNRVVYLWDVTYSTHGGRCGDAFPSKERLVGKQRVTIVEYNPKYDIYDSLVYNLIAHINTIENVQTEVVVVPFNEDVKEHWKAMATPEGKKYLIEKIENYCNRDQTHTNIYQAFIYAQEKLLVPKAKYHSDLYILTDGGHSGGKPILSTKKTIPSNDKFHDLLRNWCDFAIPNNVKGYYVLLTDVVTTQDTKLMEVLKDHECIKIITPEEYRANGIAMPATRYSVRREQPISLKEDFNKPIGIDILLEESDKKIQGVEKIHFYASENPYVYIDQEITIDSTTISGKKVSIELLPKYKGTLSELQDKMPKDVNTLVRLNFEQVDAEKSKNELVNSSCDLRFVNKPQKKLKITLQ